MYRVDWIQFLAAIVALVAYGFTIWACVAYRVPWPVTTPAMLTTFGAACVWSHRRDLHERTGGGDQQ